MMHAFRWYIRVMAGGGILAATSALQASGFDPNRHMGVDEIRPGMKGFGKSVFRGTEIATFEAEVISIIRNFDPKMDVILVRLSGQNLEHSGVVAGMSGSPVYIRASEGGPARLIGAVAYGWSYNKDPVCGVQPIGQMLDTREYTERRRSREASTQQAAASPRQSAFEEGRYALTGLMESVQRRWLEPNVCDGELRPLATPIMVSGVSSSAMTLLREQLEPYNLVPIAAGSAAGSQPGRTPIEPGSALCVPMISGDLSMTAFGTCTEVLGDQVFGFGHPFTSKGTVEFPMASGSVHTVISSVQRSFKLGSPLDIQGAILGDGSSAIYGRSGSSARMIPFEVNVDETGVSRHYHYQAVNDEFFTPLLSGIVLVNSVTAPSDLPREHTVRYEIEAGFGQQGTFRSRNIVSQSSIGWAMSELAGPLMALMDNAFGRFPVESIKATVAIEDKAHLARLLRASLSRSTVPPGHTLAIRADWRLYRGADTVTHYEFKLPDDIDEGAYQLTLTTAMGHLRRLTSEKRHLFEADNQKELIVTFNRVGALQQDELYARLIAQEGGMAVEKEEFPDLPAYRQAILADASRRQTARYVEPILQMYKLPFVMDGEVTLAFTVDKRADQ
jgi:hypothetical protein